jgi:hypothetical protein
MLFCAGRCGETVVENFNFLLFCTCLDSNGQLNPFFFSSIYSFKNSNVNQIIVTTQPLILWNSIALAIGGMKIAEAILFRA